MNQQDHLGETAELWQTLALGIRILQRTCARLEKLLAAEGLAAHKDGLDDLRLELDSANQRRAEAQRASATETAARLADELPGYPAKG